MALPLIGALSGTVLAGGLARVLWHGVAVGVGSALGRFATMMGIGFVTYTGVDLLITQNESQIINLLQTFPPVAVQLMGVLKVGVCLKIMFSAMAMRATVFGMNAGSIKKMQVTGPPAA